MHVATRGLGRPLCCSAKIQLVLTIANIFDRDNTVPVTIFESFQGCAVLLPQHITPAANEADVVESALSLRRQVGFFVALNRDPLPQLILSLHVPPRHEAVAMLALESPQGRKTFLPSRFRNCLLLF